MDIRFKVHGVSKVMMETAVKLPSGEDVTAHVPCVHVELVSDMAGVGSLSMKFMGDKAAEAEATFVPDSEHVWAVY